MSVWALLVAGGSGERLGADRPKAFANLRGRPLLAESLERLDRSDWVDAIVVAAPPGWEEPVILLAEELVASKVVAAVPGGGTRAASVQAALAEVPADAVAVLVHDAARPLLEEAVLERVLGPLSEGVDGVVPVLRLRDTVKRVRGADIVETLARDARVTAQPPQYYPADVLSRARAGARGGGPASASLVVAGGGRVRVVDGDPRLLKVTTPADLELVESWLG